MLRKIFVALTAITLGLFANAQIASIVTDTTTTPVPEAEEPKPALIITGSADVYYKYDFAKLFTWLFRSSKINFAIVLPVYS